MASKKIWNLRYVAGNPEIFSKVTSCASNPMLRSEAIEAAKTLHQDWRVWVERDDTKERVFESKAEINHDVTFDD